MTKTVMLAALLMVLAVATPAYDPPLPYQMEAIRSWTDPDVLRLTVFVDNCDVDESEVDSMIEAAMIRSRVERTDEVSFDRARLRVTATCITPSRPGESYAYCVEASLSILAGWDLQLFGMTGITPSADTIRDTMVEAAEHALTDLIYVHGQDS